MHFKVYGKFEIPLEKDAPDRIDKRDVTAFWREVEQKTPGLPNACGVYIFGIKGRLKNKSRETSMPWYIGKAEKQAFKQECFTHHKLKGTSKNAIRGIFRDGNGKVRFSVSFIFNHLRD
ncbi:MAG: hypothetical protein OXI88_11350 [Gammaproteobacteria bacterium]|nr:hypothetical protein [Gammaproteobacteria bacterium]